LARVGAGRRRADVVRDDHEDDIADPVGRPRADYEETARELDILLRQLVALLIGGPPRNAAYAASSPSRLVADEALSATDRG